MYEDADAELQRIVKLTETCPETLRPKAFEILLQGYVDSLKPRQPVQPPAKDEKPAPPATSVQDWSVGIPSEVSPRLKTMAKRRGVPPERLASLFDFSVEPFIFAPFHLPGASKNDRAKKVALLVAGRSFLATGQWVADWAEVKAMCVHQDCYDQANFSATLKAAKGEIFKSVDVGNNIELAAKGTGDAETLLASLASADASS